MDILERVENYWYESAWVKNRRAPAVASEQGVAAFELQQGVHLPADFREYFLRLNGTDGDGDKNVFRFWPLNELRRVDLKGFNLLGSDAYYFFADYLVECCYYAIYLGSDPFFQNRVILADFPGSPVIANTFTEFLELYLEDRPKLYGHPTEVRELGAE